MSHKNPTPHLLTGAEQETFEGRFLRVSRFEYAFSQYSERFGEMADCIAVSVFPQSGPKAGKSIEFKVFAKSRLGRRLSSDIDTGLDGVYQITLKFEKFISLVDYTYLCPIPVDLFKELTE